MINVYFERALHSLAFDQFGEKNSPSTQLFKSDFYVLNKFGSGLQQTSNEKMMVAGSP